MFPKKCRTLGLAGNEQKHLPWNALRKLKMAVKLHYKIIC